MRKKHKQRPTADDQAGAILTVSEVAARWRVSRHTVMSAIRSGTLQAFQLNGRLWRVREDAVLRYEQHVAPAAVAS